MYNTVVIELNSTTRFPFLSPLSAPLRIPNGVYPPLTDRKDCTEVLEGLSDNSKLWDITKKGTIPSGVWTDYSVENFIKIETGEIYGM